MNISVQKLSKQYKNQLALNAISFDLKAGEIVGFLGPNGAGKSTLMKIITGVISAFEGEVTLDGESVRQPSLALKNKIGYLSELNPLYLDMYVIEYLSFIADIHKLPRDVIKPTIENVGLTNEAHKKIKSLSKGYKQRVGLAAAIMHNPPVLLLDEPTTGLDPNQLVEIRNLIRELGKDKVLLFSTHILQEVEAVCDRVIILNKGNIVADENLQVLKANQAQVIEVEFDYAIEPRFLDRLAGLTSKEALGTQKWQLTFETREDQRAAIFDFALQNGLKIVEMNAKNKSLEALFNDLTA